MVSCHHCHSTVKTTKWIILKDTGFNLKHLFNSSIIISFEFLSLFFHLLQISHMLKSIAQLTVGSISRFLNRKSNYDPNVFSVCSMSKIELFGWKYGMKYLTILLNIFTLFKLPKCLKYHSKTHLATQIMTFATNIEDIYCLKQVSVIGLDDDATRVLFHRVFYKVRIRNHCSHDIYTLKLIQILF